MLEFLLVHEPTIRLGAFFGVLIIMTMWEVRAPRRPQVFKRRLRWRNNLGRPHSSSSINWMRI